MHKRVYAWWPVELSELRYPHWHRTGRWAWLTHVVRITTVWGDTFYKETTNDR